MAAPWARNEVLASKRRADLRIQQANGLFAPPGTDFTGTVFIAGVSSPHFVAALGTLTNKRRALVVPNITVTATDTVNDRATKVAHGLQTGDGPLISLVTAGGVIALVNYYAIRFDADQFSLATSVADAYAGTKIDITASINGMVFEDVPGTTQRGVWGHFTYEGTQAETDHAANETIIIVDGVVGGLDFTLMNGGGAYTTVEMISSASSVWSQVIENGRSAEDLLRGIARECLAKFSKVGNDYVTRDLADTKDSHSGTVTPAGRIAAAIIDLT